MAGVRISLWGRFGKGLSSRLAGNLFLAGMGYSILKCWFRKKVPVAGSFGFAAKSFAFTAAIVIFTVLATASIFVQILDFFVFVKRKIFWFTSD